MIQTIQMLSTRMIYCTAATKLGKSEHGQKYNRNVNGGHSVGLRFTAVITGGVKQQGLQEAAGSHPGLGFQASAQSEGCATRLIPHYLGIVD